MDYLLVVENALLDYSNWVSKKSVLEMHMLSQEDDLRGIFYNKLVSRLREAGLDIGKFRKSLYPTDFKCTFVAPGFIESITIPNDMGYHWSYHGPERRDLLNSLGVALSQIDMTKLSNRFNWELTKIINSLKKL